MFGILSAKARAGGKREIVAGGQDLRYLFVSCTNFRALEAKPALETEFTVHGITSNSAVIDGVERHFGSS
jgi:maleate cis-trans isomerase